MITFDKKKFADYCPFYAEKVSQERVSAVTQASQISRVNKVAIGIILALGLLAIAGGGAMLYVSPLYSIPFLIGGGISFTGFMLEIWAIILIASMIKKKNTAIKEAKNIPQDLIDKNDSHIVESFKKISAENRSNCLHLLPSTSESSFSFEDLLNNLVLSIEDDTTKTLLRSMITHAPDKFSQIPIERIDLRIVRFVLNELPSDTENQTQIVLLNLFMSCLLTDDAQENIQVIVKHPKTLINFIGRNVLTEERFKAIYSAMNLEQKTVLFKFAPIVFLITLSESLLSSEAFKIDPAASQEILQLIFTPVSEQGHYLVAEPFILKGVFNGLSDIALNSFADILSEAIMNRIVDAFNQCTEHLVPWVSRLIENENSKNGNGKTGLILKPLSNFPLLLAEFPLTICREMLVLDVIKSDDEYKQDLYLNALKQSNKLQDFLTLYLDKVHSFGRDWDNVVLVHGDSVLVAINKYKDFRIERLIELAEKLDCYLLLNFDLAKQLLSKASSLFSVNQSQEKSKDLFLKLYPRKDIHDLIDAEIGKNAAHEFLAAIFNIFINEYGKELVLLESLQPINQLIALKSIHATTKNDPEMRIRNFLCFLTRRAEIKKSYLYTEEVTEFSRIMTWWFNFENYDFQLSFLNAGIKTEEFLRVNRQFMEETYFPSLPQKLDQIQIQILTSVFGNAIFTKYDLLNKIDVNKLKPQLILEILNNIDESSGKKFLEKLGSLNATSVIKSIDGKGPFTEFLDCLNRLLQDVSKQDEVNKLGIHQVIKVVATHSKYEKERKRYPNILTAHNLLNPKELIL